MTTRTIERLLSNYPFLFDLLVERREQVLQSYRVSMNFSGRYSSGGHSDPTARVAIKLAAISERGSILKHVPVFMSGLTPWERELILTVWRCGGCMDWRWVARRMKMSPSESRLAWSRLVQSFEAYVGGVSGPDGIAFAGGPLNECQG